MAWRFHAGWLFWAHFFLECHKIRIFQSRLIPSPHFPTQVCTLSIERHVLNAQKRLNYNHWLKSNPSCNPNKWKLNISKWMNFGETSVFKYKFSPSQKRKELNKLSSIKLITGLFFLCIWSSSSVPSICWKDWASTFEQGAQAWGCTAS